MTTTTTELMDVAPSELREFKGQPRELREDAKFRDLCADVAANGVRTRLVCRRVKGKLQVLAGHRRRAAALACGLMLVPVEVRDYDDRAALIFVCAENFGHEDLRPSEEVRACAMLHEQLEFSVADIGRVTGHAEAWVQTRLALPGLGDEVMGALDEGAMPLRVAEELLRVNEGEREEAVQLVFDKAFAGGSMSAAHAVRLLEESFLRPARLEAEWVKLVGPVVRQYGAHVTVVPVRARGEYVEPWGALVRGWVLAEDDLPAEEVAASWVGMKWRDLAVDLACPMVLVPELSLEVVKGMLMLCDARRLRELAGARAESGGAGVFVKPSVVRARREMADTGAAEVGESADDVGDAGERYKIESPLGETVVCGLEAALVRVAESLRDGAVWVKINMGES